MQYKKRIADATLSRMLKGTGAVLIEGPKWCGKTTTAMQSASTVIHFDDPEKLSQNLKMADLRPSTLLQGPTPVLIDEWQIAPKLWDAIRYEIDKRGEPGQFMLTGSAVPVRSDEIHHSGAGRFAWLTMRPMSLYESGESTGEVRLKDLFDSPSQIDGISRLTLEDISYLICRGGWPYATSLDADIALDQAKYYLDAVVNSDISRADGVQRDSEMVRRLLRSYARHQGTQASLPTMAEDIRSSEIDSPDVKTLSSYIEALKKIFVVEESLAWNPNLRSKTAIRSASTRYFVDPSIAVAALGLGPGDLMEDLNTMGLLFETLCIRDLRVFAEAIDGHVYHYRDKSNLECDAVIHLRNGRYGLVEIKLGGDALITEGKETLKKLEDRIDTQKMNKPSFRMVLTATGDYAYREEDGTYIVPIGCLRD